MNAKHTPPPPPPSDTLPVPKSKRGESPFLDYIRYSEFKRLLGQLSALVDRDGIKTMAILSEYPQEGKTFFVSAMALGYASLLNKRVLIVNTVVQVQNQSLYIKKIYEDQLEYAPFLGGRKTRASRMIELISPEMDGGDSDSADTADFQIGNYINTLKDNYDLILLDTCALTASNKKNIDPIVIARQADASILLTSDRSLNRESLSGVKNVLSQWHVRLAGTIHNTGPKK